MTTYRHGFAGTCPFGHDTGRPADDSYRNIFGPAAPDEIYDGLGPGREDETKAMLLRLTQLVVDKSADATRHRGNDKIPAGYTYLAQFVAHDLVHTLAQPGQGGQRNFRQAGLVLDTLYGGGPGAAPQCYVAAETGSARVMLRLGPVRQASLDGGSPIVPDRLADLARASLPMANGGPARGMSDALIADPRNDDNVILGQLTVLFHRLHNAVYRRVWQERSTMLGDANADDMQCFAMARAIVTLTYRQVITHDLLRRLLCADVHAAYFVGRPPAALLDRDADDRIPVEFSHAVFRVGHMMVRAGYDLNPALQDTSLLELLMLVSSQESGQLPLPENWIVAWRDFFGEQARNLSRAIGPSITPFLARSSPVLLGGRPGGLLHADLMRGVEGRVRRVASLIDRLPPQLRNRLGPLAEPAGRDAAVRRWAGDDGLEKAHLDRIAQDPPLLLFVLLEAEEIEEGKSLGPLGSVIVAETFARQLERAAGLIERQPALAAAAAQVFKAAPPYDMSAVIDFVGEA